MRTQAKYEINLPDYSLPYLINSDSSGLTPEEINLIDKYMQEFYDTADSIDGHVVINPVENESSFTWRPAFGLAGNAILCEIVILF